MKSALFFLDSYSNNYYAQSVEDALELLHHFKVRNTYDIFRGQASSQWDVVSSLERRGVKYINSEDYKRRMSVYFSTLSKNKTTEFLAQNRDSGLAVAQHYGLPTNYVDFTTDHEIAVFFAMHNRPTHVTEHTCSIICVKKEEFEKEVKNARDKFSSEEFSFPRIIEIDVDNLWRLQAQKGLFIEMPLIMSQNEEILSFENVFYRFDRILFPYDANFKITEINKIYPSQKSSLEMILDQYIYNLSLEEFHEDFVKDKLTADNFIIIPGNNDSNKIFVKNIGKDVSWDQEENWIPKPEKWEQVSSSNTISITIDATYQKEKLKSLVYCLFVKALIDSNNARTQNLTLDIEIVNCQNKDVVSNILQEGLERIWNGMRIYPYSIEQISACFSNYVALIFEDYKHKFNENDMPPQKKFYAEPLYIDLAVFQSESRAYVEEADFFGCFRNQFADYLLPDILDAYKNKIWFKIFSNVSNPQYLFDFNKLLVLYVEQIIPFQVFLRGAKTGLPIFFSPFELTSLGPN